MATAAGSPSPELPVSIDPRSGYCAETKTYHSLRRAARLPPDTLPLSTTSYALSFLPSPLPSAPAFVDAATAASISFPEFVSQVRSLASALRSLVGLSRGEVALVLCPSHIHVPVLYFALLSIGVVLSPANPLSTPDEIARLIHLTRPAIAIAASSTASKIPDGLPTIVLDSPRFLSFLSFDGRENAEGMEVRQEDTAAILYSSGTTGRVKGVVLTHRNLIAFLAIKHASREAAPVVLFPVPLFHVLGFSLLLQGVAFGETTVLMERFEFGAMLQAVESHRVTDILVSPPVVVALVKSELPAHHNLSSLRAISSGGAPLGRDVAEQFKARFPHVELSQGYGLTESTAIAAATIGAGRSKEFGSVGRLWAKMEAKITHPTTREALPPGKTGELWLRGPAIMKGK